MAATPILTTITLTLEGAIAPKARPRFGGVRAYLPEGYRTWKENAIASLSDQYSKPPIEKAAIAIQLIGKHSRRADADNVAGSILDALVQSGVLRNDSMMVVASLSIDLAYHAKTAPIARITITAIA